MERTSLIAITTDGTEVMAACELSVNTLGDATFAQQPLNPGTAEECLVVLRCALELLDSLPAEIGEVNGWTVWAAHHSRSAKSSIREACDGIPQPLS